MEEVFLPPVYNESVVLTSIVNGLIATSILWTFWTPFIVFLVVPLVNAQIKDQICDAVHNDTALNIPNALNQYAYSIYAADPSNAQNIQEAAFLMQLSGNLTASDAQTDKADAIISNDTKEILGMNFNLMISMGFAAIVIVISCMSLVVWIINKYNLNGPHILAFNLTMALVIMLVEMGFFGLVAMRYIPFNPPKIIESLVQKIIDYLN